MVRHHSVTVPIYTSRIRSKIRYTIAFYRDGKRQRRAFTDLGKAKKEAKLVAEKILRGMQGQNDLKPAEREAYFAAQRILEETGVPLVAAAEDYAQCRKLLGDVPLRSAVEEFLRRTKGVKLGVTVPQLVEELLAAKVQDGMSDHYMAQLRSVLGIFSRAFPGPVLDVKAEDIDDWLRGGNLAPQTRNNRLTTLRLLFNFAKQRNFLPASEDTAAEQVPIVYRPERVDLAFYYPSRNEWRISGRGRWLQELYTGQIARTLHEEGAAPARAQGFTLQPLVDHGLAALDHQTELVRDVRLAELHMSVCGATMRLSGRNLNHAFEVMENPLHEHGEPRSARLAFRIMNRRSQLNVTIHEGKMTVKGDIDHPAVEDWLAEAGFLIYETDESGVLASH